ncbi:TIGR03084 family metal-binding protein [Prauserella cavernicola]|uniref:TIGR03084 family protein n=1 Tax=Prauserella cavernicola TaxID=2800127 RepID=A0A934QZR0_9PSEU|nr:TIGR03084 family metal-binding protein [Prauserella cavernicola]MBK1788243.1 TIGR03084 family protein [Prauserella cavernicola]
MADLEAILSDLDAESQEVDGLVAGLAAQDWARLTPAEGWTIAHQIAHLLWTDQKALLSATEPDEFGEELKRALAAGDDYAGQCAAELATAPPGELLARWREGRAELRQALASVPKGAKLPWYGPPMSVASLATARLMETWAHGQDVADALGVHRVPTGRLWHIARFGVRTRDFAFAVNSLAPPVEEFRVELTAPDGDTWAFGPDDAAERVTGSALGFCFVVTQRRHPADTDVHAEGESAREWLGIAQAFAGQPGAGREPGQFA